MRHEYLFQNIETLLSALLTSCVQELTNAAPSFVIEVPKDRSFGNLSTNVALQLASILKKKPLTIAESLLVSCKSKLNAGPLAGLIGDCKIAPPGFINFYLSPGFFSRMAEEILRVKGDFGQLPLGNGKKVLLEFVSANPTGPLSIAHGRQAVVGDSLANILAVLGFAVKREYYNNDEGNQIEILGKSVELRYRQIKGEAVDFPEDHYQGDYINGLAQELIEQGKPPVDSALFREYALQRITGTIQKELDDFGVRFDHWYSQKELGRSTKIKDALDTLRAGGFIYDKDGAVWFASTKFGDDKDRVVIKSDAKYTYLAPDIAYHRDKFGRGFEWLINIWGPDHHGYIPRMKAAVQALGHSQEALSIIIVQLATIYRQGKVVSMSTRRGQYITLREVLDEVGKDATRFFLLMRRTDSHLDFDLELAKKQSPENPVYYVQYAHARICSIIQNAVKNGIAIPAVGLDCSLLCQKEELELLDLIFQFSYTLEVCLRQLDPYSLTAYLQNLAAAFHRFYGRHRVLDAESNLVPVRLALIQCLRIVFARGLELVGVCRPEKM